LTEAPSSRPLVLSITLRWQVVSGTEPQVLPSYEPDIKDVQRIIEEVIRDHELRDVVARINRNLIAPFFKPDLLSIPMDPQLEGIVAPLFLSRLIVKSDVELPLEQEE
jgi:hypothetical protein